MNLPKIKLISHASMLIEVDGKKILTDPWFFGTAFNDGWELAPKPDLEMVKADIKDIDIIWISHEHPDHLHFPSLKWISQIIENDVEIYFQENNSTKVFDALKKLGYKNFVSMPHLKKISISQNVQIGCYAHRHLDACLAVFVNETFWLLNINDTELNNNDIKIIKNKFGNPTVLYNQFSIAGSDGIEKNLRLDAKTVLDSMIKHHISLDAKTTVPFASFVKFSRRDNIYMNSYANTVFNVKNFFNENNLQLVLQAIGGDYLEWEDMTDFPLNYLDVDSKGEKFFSLEVLDEEDLFDYEVISKEIVSKAIEKRVCKWKEVTNQLVWKLLKLNFIIIRVTDWDNEVWKLNLMDASFSKANFGDNYDISIASQPLLQAFNFPFGIQTLGVSGRYQISDRFDDAPRIWKKIRMISSLYNAEIYLSVASLLSRNTIFWIWQRRQGLIAQIFQQLRKFKK